MSQRQALLTGQIVPYELQRSRRRSIGFIVGHEGLTVRAPGWATLATIETALQEKSAWITRKLAEVRERGARQRAARIVWEDGSALPWLGASLTLRLGEVRPGPWLIGQTLYSGLALPGSADQVRARVQAWFQREARAYFAARVAQRVPQMGVQPERLMLTSAATRWGSCSAGGVIRLNWRLMHHRPEVIDYVVVHELAHLREMNHSPRFWSIVEQVLPDYPHWRRELRESAVPVWV